MFRGRLLEAVDMDESVEVGKREHVLVVVVL